MRIHTRVYLHTVCANILLGLTKCKSKYLLLHTYVSENFSSYECKVNLLMCIFAHWVVVIDAGCSICFS